MTRISRISLVVLLAPTTVLSAQGSAPGSSLVVTHVNVIPMTSPQVLTDQTVVISGDRITALGAASTTPAPRGSTVIDGRGRYLIPGLIDTHVHLYSRQHLTLYVANGVTTVFNLDGRPLHLTWRDQVAAGTIPGPRIFTVGPKFDRVDSPERAAALVEEYWRAGYDGIKIYNQVSKAEYPVLIATARKHHLLIVGHIARDPGFEETLKAGQAIAHAEEYLYTFFAAHPRDLALIPQAVTMTRASGVPVIATLVTYRNIVDQAVNFDAYVRRPEMSYWAPWELADIEDSSGNPYLTFGKDELHDLQLNYAFLQILVRELHDAGVPILTGTDGGGIANVPGFSLHDEMEILVSQCGFTPFDALRAATLDAARFLGREAQFGSVEEGKSADLVLLRTNPLDRIENARAIAGVIVRGRWLPADTLNAMLTNLPASYRADEQRATETFLRDPNAGVAFLRTLDPFFDNLSAAVVRRVALERGASVFEGLVTRARQGDPDTPLDTPEFLNGVANVLMDKGKSVDAIDLFRFNTTEHPQVAIAWDRLGRGYYKLGRFDLALQFYKKALAVDSGYWNADFARRRIKELTDK